MLTIVAMVFSILDLTNKQQAMGLPEGSIRAVIALSLIVLFAILSVFLYRGVSRMGEPPNVVEQLTAEERAKFLSERPAIQDLQIVVSKSRPTTADGKQLYDVKYHSTNPVSDDFAKQLLVLLGTLMTAITSFYLGAGTATSAVASAKPISGLAPTISGINPTAHSITSDGSIIHLQIMGANLNVITQVKIARAGAQVAATKVASNPNSVVCDIPVGKATTPPGGAAWDVVIDDGASNRVIWPSALTINA